MLKSVCDVQFRQQQSVPQPAADRNEQKLGVCSVLPTFALRSGHANLHLSNSTL